MLRYIDYKWGNIVMFNTLSYIGEKFNEANVLWAVGASIMLSQHNIIQKPNDIDILVDTKDIHKVDEILKTIGEKKVRDKVATYSTEYFYEYIVSGIDVDIMAGFKINHIEGTFEYVFDDKSISQIKNINGVSIPLTSLEDWYVIYKLIPGRESKVKIIEDYMNNNGISNVNLLKRSLKGNLPKEIKEKVEELLSNLA